MKNNFKYMLLIWALLFPGCSLSSDNNKDEARTFKKIWLIGDSTVADYTKYKDYKTKRYPQTGWGQVFQKYMEGEYLEGIKDFIGADSVIVDDRAVGGRSTRTFFQEGKWRAVYDSLQPGDFVLIQFGHNDASVQKTERYVNPEGYKEFLRLFIQQTREKGATPVLITPVARNYPWKDGKLSSIHGEYPPSMKEVAIETHTELIDLNELSMRFFTSKGQEFVSNNYFMNLPPAKYEAYPEGLKDNTHFQPEGADEVAKLVYQGIVELSMKEAAE